MEAEGEEAREERLGELHKGKDNKAQRHLVECLGQALWRAGRRGDEVLHNALERNRAQQYAASARTLRFVRARGEANSRVSAQQLRYNQARRNDVHKAR